MIFEIPKQDILRLTCRQIDNMFDLTPSDKQTIEAHFDQAIMRCEHCFEQTTNKYYNRDDQTYFNPYHSVQYMIYLYYLANTIYNNTGGNTTCDKAYYLNKLLHGLDLFYTVKLPDFFMAEHPVGTVIGGNGAIGDGFLFYQNCTVGGYHKADGTVIYPTIGNNVKMFANSAIIGRASIGNNVNIGAGALIKNEDIEDDVNVFGQSPNLIIKARKY